ncbi:MAG TPA: hypothetical protein VLG11_00625 [Candidatus Saccharimonadales bacterium]|nr:hypothetical protein [Candidatus Saccharimonadales bacterium]
MRTILASLGSALSLVASLSSSATLQLNNYSLGSSNVDGSHSATYYLEGSAGELQGGATLSAGYRGVGGSAQAQQANVPPAPTLSNNAGAYYNKLQVTLATGGNPSDVTYSLAISTDNFATTNYVQADGTIGATPVYRTYGLWGGSSGSLITGLTPNTTYKIKANALQGMYTASAYGPSASATTGTPSLTFSLSANTANLTALSVGALTTSTLNLTYSTNAGSGGYVYVMGQYGGLHSAAAGYTIPSTTLDLTAGQGFGLRSSSAAQTSGGPFLAQSPYNNASTAVVGAVLTNLTPLYSSAAAVNGGSASFGISASRNATTPAAGDYQEVLTFAGAAAF